MRPSTNSLEEPRGSRLKLSSRHSHEKYLTAVQFPTMSLIHPLTVFAMAIALKQNLKLPGQNEYLGFVKLRTSSFPA